MNTNDVCPAPNRLPKEIDEVVGYFEILGVPVGFLITTPFPEMQIVYANNIFARIAGFEDSHALYAAARNKVLDYVHPDDRAYVAQTAQNNAGHWEQGELSYRAVRPDGQIVFLVQEYRHILDKKGDEYVMAYFTDVTAKNQVARLSASKEKLENELVKSAQKYEMLVNAIPGGVGLYLGDDKMTPIFMSENAYALCGMTEQEFYDTIKTGTLAIFHPDDVPGMVAEAEASRREHRPLVYTHRVLQKDGSYRWMRVRGTWLEQTQDGYPILCTVFTDVNEQVKTERALRESEMRYYTAVQISNINIWEYSYADDTMTIFSQSPQMSHKNVVLPHYMKSVVEEGHLREDSIEPYFAMIDRLRAGAQVATAEVWIRERAQGSFWCERLTYTNIFDEAGKPVRIYCVGRDITREKEAEKRYHEEVTFREAMQAVTLASANANLTRDVIMHHKSQFAELTRSMESAQTISAYLEVVGASIPNEEARAKFLSIFSRSELLRRFVVGDSTVSMEVVRTIEGRQYWTNVSANMMRREDTGEVLAFLYSTDMTNEKIMHNVMDSIVKTDYDYLVVVNARQNTAVRYSENTIGSLYAKESENFEAETADYLRRYVCAEDMERMLREITIEHILEQLKENGNYSIYYSVCGSGGETQKKQLRFSYIDRELETFLMARVDITQMFEAEQKKQRELAKALKMAEQANAAKSEFLSQVSHEIRTPINAVIGLAQVAQFNLDDRAVVQDCIEKTRLSSEYLLSLINDLLDMSKIESGKITLKNEPIDQAAMFRAIDIIVGAQAAQKKIDFSVLGIKTCAHHYRGDALRLQQILINILSNAVKFTPQSGRVTMEVGVSPADRPGRDLVRFCITDTGIGIGAEFLPKLFEPFTQEYHGPTSEYGGNGLGLTISQRLAGLMGGEISVKSRPGEGSVFTVVVPLEIDQTDLAQAAQFGEDLAEIDFSGRRVLLVEDHPVNVMVAKKLLEHKRIEVLTAENGRVAVEMVAAAPEQIYDAILMDIRMPVMDGLEAARRIRSMDKSWAKAVPIIAMSANAFDEDMEKSQEVGMNLHLPKPIDAELLYSALAGVLRKKES